MNMSEICECIMCMRYVHECDGPLPGGGLCIIHCETGERRKEALWRAHPTCLTIMDISYIMRTSFKRTHIAHRRRSCDTWDANERNSNYYSLPCFWVHFVSSSLVATSAIHFTQTLKYTGAENQVSSNAAHFEPTEPNACMRLIFLFLHQRPDKRSLFW